MAERSGGGGFGWFVIGVAVGVAGTIWGPGLYRTHVLKQPESVRVEVAREYTPGDWRRAARFDVEFSARRPDGKDWDWPFTAPELQLCVREGGEYRKCFGPKDVELASCQGRFRCTTAAMKVPDGPFDLELFEWDDYNQPDPIGVVSCDVGQTCKFQLGQVTVRPVVPAGVAAALTSPTK